MIIQYFREKTDKIFGDQNKIDDLIPKTFSKNSYQIIHTTNSVQNTDTPLEAAKRGKNTSMWLAIENVKNKKARVGVVVVNKKHFTF